MQSEYHLPLVYIMYYRCATLALDGMALQPSLRYDCHNDTVVGFQNATTDVASNGDSVDAANQIVVFVLRGNLRSWKQIVGYYTVHHGISPNRLSEIITDMIVNIQHANIEVRFPLTCSKL